MTSTPLYDATLTDLLERARLRAEHAEARAEQAERRAALAEREARVRQALVAEQAQEQPLEQEQVQEREAPPVPSMAELLRPTPGVTRFLDALLGAPER